MADTWDAKVTELVDQIDKDIADLVASKDKLDDQIKMLSDHTADNDDVRQLCDGLVLQSERKSLRIRNLQVNRDRSLSRVYKAQSAEAQAVIDHVSKCCSVHVLDMLAKSPVDLVAAKTRVDAACKLVGSEDIECKMWVQVVSKMDSSK